MTPLEKYLINSLGQAVIQLGYIVGQAVPSTTQPIASLFNTWNEKIKQLEQEYKVDDDC